MADPKAAEYIQLQSGVLAFTNAYSLDNVNMNYQDINNMIYGTAKLTSTTFWNYYGGENHEYNVLVTVTKKDGNEETIISEKVKQSTDYEISSSGILLNIKLNNDATKTSAIKVGINNQVKSQNTYKDMDGKGAKYTILMTIPSNDNSHGDIKLQQVFYVKENCKAYDYNPLYYRESYKSLETGKTLKDCVVIKGQNTNGHWEMSSIVSEHFAKSNGENIFEYFNKINNVVAINFKWANGTTGVTPTAAFSTEQTVQLTEPMTNRDDAKNMTYQVTLANGETCGFNYNIVFVNPFTEGDIEAINVYGNGIGENKGQTMPKVIVKDNENDLIYSYDAVGKVLKLSAKATDTYKLTNGIVNVTYTMVKNPDWTEITDNMTAGSTLGVNTTTGEFIWKNEGTTLVKDYKLYVEAVVEFKDLSKVVCTIPVNLTKTK